MRDLARYESGRYRALPSPGIAPRHVVWRQEERQAHELTEDRWRWQDRRRPDEPIPVPHYDVEEEEEEVQDPAAPAVDPAPRIRHVHISGDDVLVSITGARSYQLDLKLRNSSMGVRVDGQHPYCYSMSPFACKLQLPHAGERLLGVRVRVVHTQQRTEDGGRARRAGGYSEWSPWHTCGEAKFCAGAFAEPAYVAPPYMVDGKEFYWSGGAPWRGEVFGGDEPFGIDEAGAELLAGATPGPGAYNTPSFLQFGGREPAHHRGPNAVFASNVRRGEKPPLKPPTSYRVYKNERRAK